MRWSFALYFLILGATLGAGLRFRPELPDSVTVDAGPAGALTMNADLAAFGVVVIQMAVMFVMLPVIRRAEKLRPHIRPGPPFALKCLAASLLLCLAYLQMGVLRETLAGADMPLALDLAVALGFIGSALYALFETARGGKSPQGPDCPEDG